MATEKSIVEALYDDFLLRDIFAKIVPGSIVLASILARTDFGDRLVDLATDTGWAIIVVFAGVTWLVGFAIQEIGETMRIIRHHPPFYNEMDRRFSTRIKFREVATHAQAKQAERFLVIKEATGNAASAILLAVVVIALRSVLPEETLLVPVALPASILALLAIIFMKANRSHAKKQYEFMRRVIDNSSSDGSS